jgi:AcrR family transcriptional regulator
MVNSTRRLSRAETQARTRARLLDAADQVFSKRGFFAASVEEIAARAGFSVGAVYSNFETKGELFLALFRERIAEQLNRYKALIAEAETVGAQARAPADQWMIFLRERPEYFPLLLEFAAYAARDPKLISGLAEQLRSLHEAFAAIVASGAAGAGIDLAPGSARRMGVVVTALAHGLALARLADPEEVPDELFGDFMAVFFERVPRGEASEEQ